jgi:hypothetical protein
MSDDRFGGGGANDRDPQAISLFRVANLNETSTVWTGYYQGIFRCNTLLKSLNLVSHWTSAKERQQIFGEASFLRAYFYFDLARLYGQVPLITDPTPVNLPKAAAKDIFAQIAFDLKNAIDSIPIAPISVGWKATNMGRASKWAAEGIMARVFLFYTGYYKTTDLPLPDGGSITKTQVINWIDDIVSNSGSTLVPDFRNLWPYAIKDSTHYGYAKANSLKWVMDANNTESIFEINFVTLTSDNWGQNNFYNNTLCLFQGQRNPDAQLPFAHGWGFGPVNPSLYNTWDQSDLRRQGSIWNVDDASEGTDKYVWGSDAQWEETGFYNKKYMPINIDYNGGKVNWAVKYYGAKNDIQLDNAQNTILLRLSDVLLMGAELGSSHAQAYFDQVRGRAYPGYVTGSVAATLDNIKTERRHELAFEGGRYFDLLRWYGTDAGTQIMNGRSGAIIFNNGVKTTIEQDRYPAYFSGIPQRVKDTGGFLMIPDDQIKLSKGVLEQNPGWINSSDIMY